MGLFIEVITFWKTCLGINNHRITAHIFSLARFILVRRIKISILGNDKWNYKWKILTLVQNKLWMFGYLGCILISSTYFHSLFIRLWRLKKQNTKRNSSGLLFPFTSPYYNIELVVCESTIYMSVFTKFMLDINISISYLCHICHEI